MAKNLNRLGKGLNALVTSTEPATASIKPPSPPALGETPQQQILDIRIDAIRPNPRQPRTTFDQPSLNELADSIRNNGLLQPLLLRRTTDGAYELVAGERRLRAARLAGLTTVPATVRELSDSQSFEIALVENLQREDLGPLERAAAYQQYLETFGGTVEDLAKRLCESRANISNYMRLLKLHPEVCYLLGNAQLGMGQARALAGITEPHKQLAIARLASRRNLSVRQVEELVRRSTADESTKVGTDPREPQADRTHLSDVEKALSRELGLPVRLRPGRKKNSGRVVIRYTTLDEFDRIAERLGGRVHLE